MKDEIPYFGAGSLVVLPPAFPVKAEIYDIRIKSDSDIDQFLENLMYLDIFLPQTILFVRSGQLPRIEEKLSTMPELIVIAKDAPGDFRGVFAEMKSQETTLMWKE